MFLSRESKILMSFDSCDYAVFKMVNYITVRGLLFFKGAYYSRGRTIMLLEEGHTIWEGVLIEEGTLTEGARDAFIITVIPSQGK